MTRESRSNLIFLVVLLAASLPGMFLLGRKALRGEGGLNASPPSRNVNTPYLHPVSVDAETVRTVPPRTLLFVDEVSQGFVDRPADRPIGAGGRPLPVVSDGRHFEVLFADGETIALLLWHHARGPAEVDEIAATVGGTSAEVVRIEPVEVPEDVREELQGYGYPRPPTTASLVEIKLPATAEGRRLTLAWTRGGEGREDGIDLNERP